MLAPTGPVPDSGELFGLLPPGVQGCALGPDVSGDVTFAALHPQERLLLRGMEGTRANQFAAGRACARLALDRLGVVAPVLIRPDGAPAWASGVRGSISHKGRLAIAVVARVESVTGLGIDLEDADALPPPVWDAVLTPVERARLRAIRGSAVTARLIFSAKEAYYKWFRSTGRDDPVGFQDVEVEPRGGKLWYRPGPGLPEPSGAYRTGQSWLLALAWSGPAQDRR